jgi:hypothetical protein
LERDKLEFEEEKRQDYAAKAKSFIDMSPNSRRAWIRLSGGGPTPIWPRRFVQRTRP